VVKDKKMNLKIKICGITNLTDALLAVELGAWAIGFVFYEKSPRFINNKNAFKIIKATPSEVLKVGVFVNQDFNEIKKIKEETEINAIQLHGEESEDFCLKIADELHIPVIKAFRINDFFNPSIIKTYKNKIFAALLDTYSPTEYGGTGKSFNPKIAKEALSQNIPIIVAGGITPDNIREIYEKTKPFAIDVSSGVEKEKGLKDPEKMKELFNEAKSLPKNKTN